MKITVDIDAGVVELADAVGMTPEEWVRQAIVQKADADTAPAEPEARRLAVLARLLKVYRTTGEQTQVEFAGDDGSTLLDLESRGYVDLGARGFVHAMQENYHFISGAPGSPVTPEGIAYLERTKVDKFVEHPLFRFIKEIKSLI
jgi:hypothetical protein